MNAIPTIGILPWGRDPMAGSSRAVRRQVAAFRTFGLLLVGLLALLLMFVALTGEAGASHNATWSNTPPAVVASIEDGASGQTWSETLPSIITTSAGDGGSSWFNSAPEIVVSSIAQNDPAWGQTVPPQAAAR